MEVFISDQLLVALYSVIFGSFLWLIYDLLKFIRSFFSGKLRTNLFKSKCTCACNEKRVRSKYVQYVTQFIWDLIYFIIITPTVLIFVYATSYGILRWYIIAGIILGFIPSYVLFSHLTAYIYDVIIYAYKLIWKIIKYPFERSFIFVIRKLKSKKRKAPLKGKNGTNKGKISNREKLLYTGRKTWKIAVCTFKAQTAILS